ncbi:jg7487 [Pararge aegeria aegeria]|uniref:Jg7487 protein n=1 Tax=Pararge aegeria aegeria TaxID=348720 RepID=A0A8S4R9A9_9NEOP|nr:jg7487 [Pararge aegeria aegeria]
MLLGSSNKHGGVSPPELCHKKLHNYAYKVTMGLISKFRVIQRATERAMLSITTSNEEISKVTIDIVISQQITEVKHIDRKTLLVLWGWNGDPAPVTQRW